MRNKRILISGYYGFDNFGDDAVLHTLLSGIKENDESAEITVISKNPAKIKELYGVNSVKTFDFAAVIKQIFASDLFISGGGSLLQDTTSLNSLLYYLALIFLAQLSGVKTFIYAQGIGPIRNKFGLNLAKFLLKRVNEITVRDQQSYDFLKNLKIESTLTADPVWNIETAGCTTVHPQHPHTVIPHLMRDLSSTDKSSRMGCQPINIKSVGWVGDPTLQNPNNTTKIGIQLRNWHSLDEQKLNNFAQSIAANFSDEKDEKYEIILISLQDSLDLEITKKFEEILKAIKPDLNIKLMSGLSIFEAVSIISELNYLIGMRYHACLVGIKFVIPVLPISYDPKVESLSAEAKIPYLKIEELNDKEVLNRKMHKLKDKNSNFKSELKDFSAKKQLESRQNVYLLVKMIMSI